MMDDSLLSASSLDSLRRQDELCLEFERQWQTGREPRLEDYLAEEPSGGLPFVRELLWVEIEYRKRSGEAPAFEEYSSRLPRYLEAIKCVIQEGNSEAAIADRYQVVDDIAIGGLGRVQRAYDRELRREVAIKELRDRHSDQDELRRRFLRECHITSRLEHPGIVPIYDLGNKEDGKPFYAMRLIRGRSLQTEIDDVHGEKRLDDRRFRGLLRNLIDAGRAVEYAHKQGVVHRDLKPANIMIGPYGETLVVDWGLAKSIAVPDEQLSLDYHAGGSMETRMGTVIGTPAYMSPEQAAGQMDQVGPHSDVYGLGATMYAILTGKKLFEGADDEVRSQVQNNQIQRPSQRAIGIPPALESICLKALAGRPEERYPTAEALVSDIQNWLDDEPVSVHRYSILAQIGRWMRHHRATTVAALAVLIVSSIALAIGTAILSDANRELAASRQLAQNNFEQARHTVDDLLTDVSEQSLLKAEGLQPLRRKLLNRALSYYQDFIKQDENNELVRSGLAASYYRAGQIAAELGERDQGIASIKKAIELQRELLDTAPDSHQYRAALAQSYDDMAIIQLLTNRFEEASESLNRAMDLHRDLLRDFPEDPEIKNASAGNLGQIAYLTWYTDAAKATEIYQQARLVREEIVQEYPDRLDFRRDLAKIYNNLGLLRREVGEFNPAIEMHEQAQVLQEGILMESPDDMEVKSVLAKILANKGIAQADTGDLVNAGRSYREASELFEQLAVANPLVPGFQIDRAKMIANEAEQARSLGDTDTALSLLLESLGVLKQALAADESLLPARMSLSHVYLAMGRAYRSSGQPDPGLEAMALAAKNHKSLLADDPTNHYIRGELVTILWALAELQWHTGEHSEAVLTYRSAISNQQKLVEHSGPESSAASYLAQMVEELGGLTPQLSKELQDEVSSWVPPA